MPKIIHVADVHLRALQRHDEYKTVFKALIQDCKDKNVDHIFIGGDVWHQLLLRCV